LFISPIIYGSIVESTTRRHGYFYAEIFVIIEASLGIVAAIVLNWLDFTKYKILNVDAEK